MNRQDMNFININTDEDLGYSITRIKNGPIFAEAFKFESDELKNQLFSALGISLNEFNQKYYFHDDNEKLHISESEENYIWISTMGLIENKDRIGTANNHYVNSCRFQYIALSLLVN